MLGGCVVKSILGACLVLGLTACGAADSGVRTDTAATETATSHVSTTESTMSTVTTSSAGRVSTASSIQTTTPTTAPAADVLGVVLEPNGLGLIDFGDPFQEVMDELQSALGLPTYAEPSNPDSPSRTEFVAGWAEAGLGIGFSTRPVLREDGELHFTRWHTDWKTPASRMTLLKTAEGVGWGSTLTDLEDVYGDHFWIHSDECAPPGIIIPGGDRSAALILVSFDQQASWDEDGTRYFEDPDSTRVVGMEAGASEGC